MANEVSIYEPRTMGRVVQKLPPVRTFFRSTFFRHEETFTTKDVDVDFQKGQQKGCTVRQQISWWKGSAKHWLSDKDIYTALSCTGESDNR